MNNQDRGTLTLNSREKIARVMGWTTCDEGNLWRDPDSSNMNLRDDPPDPFTDANDDYAVLEWMRKDDQRISGIRLAEWTNFIGALPDNWQYQIGNYARAALKALEKADE